MRTIVSAAGQLKALPRTAIATAQVYASFELEQPCEFNIKIYKSIHNYTCKYIVMFAYMYFEMYILL